MARTLLIDIGELESGVVDALCPERDEPHPFERLVRTASTAAGRLFGDVLRERPPWRSMHHLYQAVRALNGAGGPDRVSLSVAEGYAYYALYPESYVDAARAIAHDWPHGTCAAVVGLRSIGTSLSAAVTAGLEEAGASVASWTVRPHGHPFSRELRPGPSMTAAWAAAAARWWLVVDEGPGLSGSSLASAARALTSAGVDPDRIVLVPHWRPDIAKFAPEVRAVWAQHRVVAASDAPVSSPAAHARRAFRFLHASDWSGGRWRVALLARPHDWPAVHPAHERLKWSTTLSLESAVPRLVKFAGLGAYGRRVADRAQAAADAGFAPPVLACRDGWLATAIVRGRPVGARHATRTFVDRVADYLAWLDAQPPAATAADWAAIEYMTTVNARELLGAGAADTIARAFATARPALDDRPPQPVDGRLLPHEWIGDGARYWKIDGAEHADDHFFPGPLDVAWDVAAVLAEFAWPEPARAHFVDRYVRLTRDRWLAERLPICATAYLAFRAGYAVVAGASLSDAAEIARFDAARRRYTAQLRRAVGMLRPEVRRAAVGGRRAADRDRRA